MRIEAEDDRDAQRREGVVEVVPTEERRAQLEAPERRRHDGTEPLVRERAASTGARSARPPTAEEVVRTRPGSSPASVRP